MNLIIILIKLSTSGFEKIEDKVNIINPEAVLNGENLAVIDQKVRIYDFRDSSVINMNYLNKPQGFAETRNGVKEVVVYFYPNDRELAMENLNNFLVDEYMYMKEQSKILNSLENLLDKKLE